MNPKGEDSTNESYKHGYRKVYWLRKIYCEEVQ